MTRKIEDIFDEFFQHTKNKTLKDLEPGFLVGVVFELFENWTKDKSEELRNIERKFNGMMIEITRQKKICDELFDVIEDLKHVNKIRKEKRASV